MARKKENKQQAQASVTYQTTQARKAQIEAFGKFMGWVRMQGGEEAGNISLTINVLVDFAFSHPDLVADWVKAKSVNAMKEVAKTVSE